MHNNLAGQLLPKEQWFVSSNQYVDIASCVVDVELAELEEGKELSIEARAFDIWFTAKSSDYLQDYTLFMEIMPHAFIVVLHKTVYVATRPKLPKAPEVTQEKVPRINDPLEPSGSASTKKRTRKRSKSTS
ncbi:MAG TPA: hypothetical protein ENI05_13460 [Porticoccus sp.]|nr:hypothetical protein [Porticoccus sp.]